MFDIDEIRNTQRKWLKSISLGDYNLIENLYGSEQNIIDSIGDLFADFPYSDSPELSLENVTDPVSLLHGEPRVSSPYLVAPSNTLTDLVKNTRDTIVRYVAVRDPLPEGKKLCIAIWVPYVFYPVNTLVRSISCTHFVRCLVNK